MLYTEEAVKANIRNKGGKRVFYLDRGDTLTSAARDWLNGERIEILSADQAKNVQYKLLSGGFTDEKPEWMTHLNGDILVSKLHPRILFRGAVDTLEAELILTQLKTDGKITEQLGELLKLTREIVRCDVLEEPLQDKVICGLTEQEIRARSHYPQDYYRQPHFMPEYSDGEQIARINRTRCAARQAELKAVAAFTDRDGNPTRTDIIRALNRISSMLYVLMIQIKAGMMNE